MFVYSPAQPGGHTRPFTRPTTSLISSFLTIALGLFLACSINAATYTGSNTGSIADGGSPNHVCGPARNVQFAVSGFSGGIGSVSVRFTSAHTWIGDLEASLIAPDGTTHLLFSRIGLNSTSSGDWGDDANFNSTYIFDDLAALNIWTVAASSGSDAFNMPGGTYRAQLPGPFANDNPGPAFSNLNATFAGLNPANINGTWTLRFRDCAVDYVGSVSAAQLTLLPTLAGDAKLSGNVVTADGVGIRNAVVTIVGGTLEKPRSVATGTFGSFVFDGLDAGETYIVQVSAKRFAFSEPVTAVALNENLSGILFVADQ